MQSLWRNRTSSGGAGTVAARPTAGGDSRLPSVSSPGSPGPSPTMRIIAGEFARRGLSDSRRANCRVYLVAAGAGAPLAGAAALLAAGAGTGGGDPAL